MSGDRLAAVAAGGASGAAAITALAGYGAGGAGSYIQPSLAGGGAGGGGYTSFTLPVVAGAQISYYVGGGGGGGHYLTDSAVDGQDGAIRLVFDDTISPADLSIAGITVPAPAASAPAPVPSDPTAVDLSIAGIAVPAPAVSDPAPAPASDPVNIAVPAITVPSPAARTPRIRRRLADFLDIAIPAVTVPAPAAGAPAPVPSDFTVADLSIAGIAVPAPAAGAPAPVPASDPVDIGVPAITVPAPAAVPPGVVVVDPLGDYRITQSSLAPVNRIVTCVEITHPDSSDPVRLVDDGEDVTIGGVTYSAARFESTTTGDAGDQAPRGQLVIGNVGREMSQWIADSRGGIGGACRVFEVLVEGDAPSVQWELTMDIAAISEEETVSVTLGFDPLLDQPLVAMRYDPQTAPGLF